MTTRGALGSALAASLLGLAATPAGCAARPSALEPRYVAVHNALTATGLTPVGPLQQGSLAEGREARFRMDLPAQCSTVVAIGSAGVRDLDVTLLDADDKVVAKDTTRDAEPVLRVCPERAGPFTAVVRMRDGAGSFLVASWAGLGSVGGTTAAMPASERTSGRAGTCDSPIPLAAGTVMGNTRQGDAEHTGSCGNAEAKELVYKLEVSRRQRVVIEVDPSNFDSVLYVRKDDCAERDAEVACNDDTTTGSKRSASTRGSRIDELLDPGTYYVFVDGYGSDAGLFRLSTQLSDAPSLEEACRGTRPLVQKTSGNLNGGFNHGVGKCDLGKGPDDLYRLDLPQRARVRIVMRSEDLSPVVHVRRACIDEQSELGCSDSGVKPEEAAFVSVLDRGSYTVFADSADKSAHGGYVIQADLTSETGAGVAGDSCADAIPLALNEQAASGDTFDAKDDITGRCTAPGAPDVVYRFEVARRSRVTAKLVSEEGDHVFVLSKSCTDRSTEIACGPIIDEVLAPGPYWLAVDGGTKGPFGRYSFQLRARDVTLQEAACRAPPSIALGQTITGTTVGAGDRFTTSCAGREDMQGSADRVYKLTLSARAHVQLLLSTPNHDGVLAIRRTCVDPPQMKSARVAEVACNNDSPDNRHSKIDTTLDAGTYFVVVDGHQAKNEGAFTLEARAVK